MVTVTDLLHGPVWPQSLTDTELTDEFTVEVEEFYRKGGPDVADATRLDALYREIKTRERTLEFDDEAWMK